MNISDYKFDNFHSDTLHALKFLWLYNRKSYLWDQHAQQGLNPPTSVLEQLSQETGLSHEELHYFNNIGFYISQYSKMMELTPQQLKEHIDSYEHRFAQDQEYISSQIS